MGECLRRRTGLPSDADVWSLLVCKGSAPQSMWRIWTADLGRDVPAKFDVRPPMGHIPISS